MNIATFRLNQPRGYFSEKCEDPVFLLVIQLQEAVYPNAACCLLQLDLSLAELRPIPAYS